MATPFLGTSTVATDRKNSGPYQNQDLTESTDRTENGETNRVEVVVARNKMAKIRASINESVNGAGTNYNQTDTSREKLVKQEKMCIGLIVVGAIFLCAFIALLVCTILLFKTTSIATSREDITQQKTFIEYAIDSEYRIHQDASVNGYIKGEVSLTTDMHANIDSNATLAVSENKVEIISKTYNNTNISFINDNTIINPVGFYSHGNVSFEASVMGESDGIISASLSRYDLLGKNHVVKKENKTFTKGQRIFFRNYSSNDPGYYILTMYTTEINGSNVKGTIETRTITYNILDPNQIFKDNCTINIKVETSCSLSIQQSITDIKSYGIVLIFKSDEGMSYQVKVRGNKEREVILFLVALAISTICLCAISICFYRTHKKRLHLKNQLKPKFPEMQVTNQDSNDKTRLIYTQK